MIMPNLAADATWRTYFEQPQIAAMTRAAHMPARGLVAMNTTGRYQLYAWENGDLRQLTDVADGVLFGGISPDGQTVYYFGDGGYVRVPFAGSQTATSIAPDIEPYQSASVSQSLNGRLVGFSASDETGHTTMYVLPVDADGNFGTRTVLYTSPHSGYGPWFDHDATYAVIATTELTQTADHGLMAFPLTDADAPQTVRVLHEDGVDLNPVAFAPLPGDTRLLATTDTTGVTRPLIWDVNTGDRIDLPLDDLDGDMGAWGWSPDGRRLLLFRVHQASYQLYVYDLDRSTLTALDHAPGAYYGGFFQTDDEILTIWTNPSHPAHVVALDGTNGARNRTLISPKDTLTVPEWRSITFQSGGGSAIQAWLATPDPARFGEGPYATIIHAHDGPFDVQLAAFNAETATWLAHGVAWMSVNYRGSTTFGPDHQGSIIGILGHREVDDLVAARAWLAAQGISDPARMVLSGRGYGGYLALQTIGRHPEGWAGAVATDPIINWADFHRTHPPAVQQYIEMLFGGDPAAYPKLYTASSPITYADAVETPVLIIAETNDSLHHYADQLGEVTVHGHASTPADTMARVLEWAQTRM